MKKQAFLFSAGEYNDSISYEKKKLDLSGVKYDIQAMNIRLKQIGFTVITKENADKAEYFSTFSEYTKCCPTDTINIVYFTGHGGYYNGNNYIFPSNYTSLYDSTQSVDKSSINILDIISAFKGKGHLILILDACRINIGKSNNYYSEMVSAENVYIAYSSCFNESSVSVSNSLSWFTEAICDEILSPNIDVDELFTRVRQNVVTKHGRQLPSSVNSLLEKIYLNSISSYNLTDKQVYDFVENNADEYNKKHGYFQGEELVFIDTAQYFNIGLLDAYWFYTKVKNSLSEEKGIKMPILTEDEYKIVKFSTLIEHSNRFSVDNWYTWYYNNRQIRMGEIPPLPCSMQFRPPELSKDLIVNFNAKKESEQITIFTNLPDDCQIFITDNEKNFSKLYTVSSGKIVIQNAQNITALDIDSSVFTNDADTKIIFGEKQRNLTGPFVKYHPIHGNRISCHLEFDK